MSSATRPFFGLGVERPPAGHFPGYPAAGGAITNFVENPAQPLVNNAENSSTVGDKHVLRFSQDITRPTSGTKTLFRFPTSFPSPSRALWERAMRDALPCPSFSQQSVRGIEYNRCLRQLGSDVQHFYKHRATHCTRRQVCRAWPS